MPMLDGVVPEACLEVAKELASSRRGWVSTAARVFTVKHVALLSNTWRSRKQNMVASVTLKQLDKGRGWPFRFAYCTDNLRVTCFWSILDAYKPSTAGRSSTQDTRHKGKFLLYRRKILVGKHTVAFKDECVYPSSKAHRLCFDAGTPLRPTSACRSHAASLTLELDTLVPEDHRHVGQFSTTAYA